MVAEARSEHVDLLLFPELAVDLKVDALRAAFTAHAAAVLDPADLVPSQRVDAIVSAGADKPFGHPAPAVLQRLRDRRILALGTHSLGQIVLEPSGPRGFRISLPGRITIREGASR